MEQFLTFYCENLDLGIQATVNCLGTISIINGAMSMNAIDLKLEN